MPKYRLLSESELKELEKEFIDYLVINGITSDEWVKIKQNEPDKAKTIIELFSDVVFEKILRSVEYLEVYEKNSVRSFYCGKEEIRMITMEVENETADFKNPEYIKQAMISPPEDLLIYNSDKPYKEKREVEIFRMIQSGCLISEGKLFQALEKAIEN